MRSGSGHWSSRLPFYFGWLIIGIAFVTMAIGVTTRTAFSLLMPPLIDEFGWQRGLAAGAFSFGFLVSAILSPVVGRVMDARGPRVVILTGLVLMTAGLFLAPLIERPWHLYVTLGLLVSAGANMMTYTAHSQFLPYWFVRWRGLAVSIALLPVLNIVPIVLGESLYHDRYAACAIAMACVLLPSLIAPTLARWRIAQVMMPLVALVWLGFAVVNIRVTVPLWADEVSLWQWALRKHPDSVAAKGLLLSAYLQRDDAEHARALADDLVATHAQCAPCMLNAANLAIAENDLVRAERAMQTLQDGDIIANDIRYLPRYVLTYGKFLELQRDFVGAEQAYRDAIRADPQDPEARMALATILAKQGKTSQAREMADEALRMYPPDQRASRHQTIEKILEMTRP